MIRQHYSCFLSQMELVAAREIFHCQVVQAIAGSVKQVATTPFASLDLS